MSPIVIPETWEAAQAALSNLGSLITSREWERAAIVAALVGPAPGSGGNHQSRKTDFAHTPTTLSTEKIVGLTNRETIARYRDAWCGSGEGQAGLPAPRLGQKVSMPNLPWPPNSKTGDTAPGAQKVKDVKNNATAVAVAMADPVFREKVLGRMPDGEVESLAWAAEDRGMTDDQKDTRRITKEQAARRSERESQPDTVTELGLGQSSLALQTVKDILGKLARDDQWEAVQAARDFADGLLDGRSAKGLTPEMFQ